MFRGSTIKCSSNKKRGFPPAERPMRRRSLRLHQQSVAKMWRLELDHQAMNPKESLISAIRSVDVNKVEKLLNSEIEYEINQIHSVLHTAVELIATHAVQIDLSKDAIRRMVEVLLESGRFNVEALTHSSETPLHIAIKLCACKDMHFYGDDYRDLVNAIIELLLKNNANINAKNSRGETPLMRASYLGCSHIVQLLLDWRDKDGAGVDLNARNIFGETALIIAATGAYVDVVELLLQHGCLDEFQDHRGFYALHAVINALHAVIYGSSLYSDASKNFLDLTELLASEETPVVLNRYDAHMSLGNMTCEQLARNDSIWKTVSMLVTRGCANINSLDFRGNTVLDLALKSKVNISQKAVERLMEYGATSSAHLNKRPEYAKNTLQYTDKLGKTPLHRLSTVLPVYNLGFKVRMLHCERLLTSNPHKEAFEEMTVAKDNRARTVLHYAVMPVAMKGALTSENILLLINDLNLKRTINKRDKYRRTPLHYCQDEAVYKSLVEQGANEHIQDVDGKTPRDLKKLRNEEYKRHNMPCKLDDKASRKKIDAWVIWKDSEYAYRDEFSKTIFDKVRQFINRLSEEISKKDPRFTCRSVLIGSAEEGTKTGLPDEFDFNFILTKLSDVCEVAPSPEAPIGFVRLKQRSSSAEDVPTSQDLRSQERFDELFRSGGVLVTTEIACKFRILYLQVMSEPEFWEGEDFLEWDHHSEVGMVYDKQERQFKNVIGLTRDDFMPSVHPCNTIQLKLNRPIDGKYMFTLISLDIVPCIQLNGWWPEGALPSISDKVKLGGCHLVFDQPQRNYPWVPFSDPFARISFAPAEGRFIKECSAMARAAYMVGKQLICCYNKSELTYVLKNCLLYCIETLKDCTSNSLLYEDINPAELRFFVEKLMLCFHEFYLQDFLPCYMMPSFHLPIEGYLKSNHDKPLYDSRFQYDSFAHDLYRKVCPTEYPVDFCPPNPEPLSEKFNREELLGKLSMDRPYIEQKQVIYGRIQPESIATGQIVRSDSQSGSQERLSTERKRRLQMSANKTTVKKGEVFQKRYK